MSDKPNLPMNNIFKNKNSKSSSSGNFSSTVAICIVGAVVIGFIFLLAKGLFTSNDKEVPQGIDTATINTDVTNKKKKDESAVAVNKDVSSADSSKADSSSADSSSADSSNPDEYQKMYVTQYAYLHTQPSNDAENIVCMSPGVEVDVLGFEDNGYVKITFMNIDGQLTGYIYKDYLASYDNQVNNAEENAQPVQTDDTQQQTDWQAQQNYDNGGNDYQADVQNEQNNW